MKRVETVWIDGFDYTKKEYQKYFPQGHGNRTAINRTVYVESFWEKLAKVGKKAAYYVFLTFLFAMLVYLVCRMGNTSLFQW